MKKAIITVAIAFSGSAFIGFTLLQQSKAQVSDKIISWFFAEKTRWSDPSQFPDTTLHFTGKLNACCGQTNNEVTRNYPYSHCDVSPAYIYYAMYITFDREAYWNYSALTYDENMRSNFKNVTNGIDVIKSRFFTLSVDRDGSGKSEFRFYNAQALLNAFNNLYRKPSDQFYGISLQRIYNTTMKDYCRDASGVMAKVMARKPEFEKIAAQYLYRAKTDTAFEGQQMSWEATEKFLGHEFSGSYKCLGYGASRIVGMMLRRQCDGSLPILLSCYKRMVQDYDPEFYLQIRNKF